MKLVALFALLFGPIPPAPPIPVPPHDHCPHQEKHPGKRGVDLVCCICGKRTCVHPEAERRHGPFLPKAQP